MLMLYGEQVTGNRTKVPKKIPQIKTVYKKPRLLAGATQLIYPR
jgi:hypothetical protein